MFQKGDRIRVKENGLTAIVSGTSFNSIHQESEVYVVWDSFKNKGECCYMTADVKDLWEKIDSIAGQQVVGLDYAPADTNDRLPRGLNSSSPDFMSHGVMPGEATKKECQHKWVEVGFMHTKTVCYHCDMEKQ